MKSHLLSHGTFTEAEIARVLSHFEEKRYRKKEYILQAGSIERYQYFIEEGCIRGFIIDYQGKEHNIAFGFKDYWFGDMESFVNHTKANYNFQALEALTVLAISKDHWDKLTEEIPAFASYASDLFRNAMIFQQNRIADHFMYSAEQRYFNLIEKFPEILTHISLKNIASYLGVTPEFISILRKKAMQK